MSVDVKEIADGLTTAQRAALVRHASSEAYGDPSLGWPQKASDETGFCKAGYSLMIARLIAWAGPRSSATSLTPLGLAVKAHLLATEPTA